MASEWTDSCKYSSVAANDHFYETPQHPEKKELLPSEIFPNWVKAFRVFGGDGDAVEIWDGWNKEYDSPEKINEFDKAYEAIIGAITELALLYEGDDTESMITHIQTVDENLEKIGWYYGLSPWDIERLIQVYEKLWRTEKVSEARDALEDIFQKENSLPL